MSWDVNSSTNSFFLSSGIQLPSGLLKFEITKTASDFTPIAGEDLIYTIDVYNHGPSLATNVVVTDTLPAGVTYLLNTDNCTYDDVLHQLVCQLGDIMPGETESFQVVVEIEENINEQIVNFVEVDSDVTDPDETNNQNAAESSGNSVRLRM